MTTVAVSGRGRVATALRKNRARLTIIAALSFIFLSALFEMEAGDWFITILRGLAVGAITFLVASGLSLIFGLMDVLNLAHGELFMLGAYVGWTVYVRPDTFVDVIGPLAVLVTGLGAARFLSRLHLPELLRARWAVGLSAVLGAGAAIWGFTGFPLSKWDLDNFADAPASNSLALETGSQQVPAHIGFEGGALVAIVALLIGGLLIALAAVARREVPEDTGAPVSSGIPWVSITGAVVAAVFILGNEALTTWLFDLGTTPRFFVALLVATVGGFLMGIGIEMALIRPLYGRPLYQLMITLGLGFILIELVRFIWGRPEFTMPKPAIFSGAGDGCPGQGFGGLFSGCSTIEVFGNRVRMFNEVFIITVGVVVLILVTLLLNRTRLGLIIKAGVQDDEMVEALGINVRRVFTLVFGLGVALAAFGGVIAAPALGLGSDLGARVLLLALVAMAVGGLTSFPGAAAGAVLVGLLQQFITRFGQSGIPLPWLEEPFKLSPALIPASGILLMVIVLLVLPHGLLGRED